MTIQGIALHLFCYYIPHCCSTRAFPKFIDLLLSYQNILVENPRAIFHPCRVHFHRAVTQLAVDGINTTWSDSEVITVAIVLIYT